MDYGARLMEYDRPAKAIEALTKASSLYHAWWDWAPEVRAAFGDILEKASEAGEDYYFAPEDIGFVEVQGIREHDVAMGAPAPVLPEAGALIKSQPDSCDAADGYLARLELLKGNFEAVGTLYDTTFDLDTYVADIQGAAALVSGEPQKAQAALRQAIKREWHTGPVASRRAALAQAYIALDDRQTADDLLSRGLELSDSIVLHDQWIENSLELRGLGPTIQLAKERAEQRPSAIFAQLAAAKIAIDAGREGQAKPDMDRAQAELLLRQGHFKTDGATYIAAARLNVLKGELNLAEKHAQKATEVAPELGAGWYVAAEVAEAKGDAAQAKVWMKRAVQASPTVIPFARVLADAAE
jgi:tetratricopeptide (TPR) repeat protein